MYKCQYRINIDFSGNPYTDYLSAFRDFFKLKRTILKSVCGLHKTHCEHPHVHMNFLVDKPVPKSFKYHYEKYLAKKGLSKNDISGNISIIQYKPIELSGTMTEDSVMGYPLKEGNCIEEFTTGYSGAELKHMTEVAQAYFANIDKCKTFRENKEAKKLNEQELMYKYLDENLITTFKNPYKKFNLHQDEDVPDKVHNEMIEELKKVSAKPHTPNPYDLWMDTQEWIIGFYEDYDVEKMPITKTALAGKATRYLFKRKLITKRDYMKILYA